MGSADSGGDRGVEVGDTCVPAGDAALDGAFEASASSLRPVNRLNMDFQRPVGVDANERREERRKRRIQRKEVRKSKDKETESASNMASDVGFEEAMECEPR